MKQEKRSNKMASHSLAILSILFLILGSSQMLSADEIFRKSSNLDPITFNPLRNQVVNPILMIVVIILLPQWEFETLPDSIMTSYYDYMPFSYRGFI